MAGMKLPDADLILDSLHDGLYVCDKERRIIYWSKSAERITGWGREDVLGRQCLDQILVHTDKDGFQLCGEEFCPLHRSMLTDQASTCPVMVFGQTKEGARLPMMVSVAPLHDANGQVIGGVETFHDFSESYANLERAKRIQALSLEQNLPTDPRIDIATFYLPHDIIGGDFFGIRQLDGDHYGFFLVDLMGHGVAAALHTMHLSAIWNRHALSLLMQPAQFARLLNRELCKVVGDESFATAVCGILDLSRLTVRIASAGGPPLILIRRDGSTERLTTHGLPLGMIADADYEEREFSCGSGDCLLSFTDGAVEIHDAAGHMLGHEGLVKILSDLGCPNSGIMIDPLRKALLNFSNGIRLADDLTLLEFRFA